MRSWRKLGKWLDSGKNQDVDEVVAVNGGDVEMVWL